MNYKAIDAGFDAFVKIEVPASWADAKDAEGDHELAGNPATVKMVKEILFPVDKMDGDSLPVSAFVDHVDGQFEQGASAYEKRGVAVSVPEWDVTKCIQCNQCAYVCPHATIRPFALTAEEVAAAPAALKVQADDRQGLRELPVRHDRLSAGLHGLRRLRRRLPGPRQGAEDDASGEPAGPAGSVRLCCSQRGARKRA